MKFMSFIQIFSSYYWYTVRNSYHGVDAVTAALFFPFICQFFHFIFLSGGWSSVLVMVGLLCHIWYHHMIRVPVAFPKTHQYDVFIYLFFFLTLT